MADIAGNLKQIKENITRFKRVQDVRLVAVTKTVDVPEIREVLAAGVTDLGESKAQVLERKARELSGHPEITWHFIGHLQTNKVNKVVPIVEYIHSVDRLKLLKKINNAAAGFNKRIKVFLEVNVSGEENKHGFSPEELLDEFENFRNFQSIDIIGLMTMAPLYSSEADQRRIFGELAKLAEEIVKRDVDGLQIKDLSMGMSNDYIPALKEGATVVRIGSAIFK